MKAMAAAATAAAVMSIIQAPLAWARPARCAADTGDRSMVLVELYTSEGCDSCPPADALLSKLTQQAAPAGTIVPLAFHVDYWDRLGWKDRYADPRYTERQWVLAGRAGSRLVYTPQFLRNGADWRDRGRLFAPAGAGSPVRIRAELRIEDGALAVTGEVSTPSPAEHEVFVAAYENNLVSEVRAGENAGRRLRHDFVVRALAGPIPVDAAGTPTRLQVRFPLGPDWKRPDTGVVVFVQDRKRAAVIQSLRRHACEEGAD